MAPRPAIEHGVNEHLGIAAMSLTPYWPRSGDLSARERGKPLVSFNRDRQGVFLSFFPSQKL